MAGLEPSGGTTMLAALLPAGEVRYLGLFVDAEATTEVTDANYVRVAYTGWTQSVDGLSRSNSSALEWAGAAAAGTVGALGVFDDAVAGNLLFVAEVKLFDNLVELDATDFIRFEPGGLVVSIGGG